ncbi:MULTISPECIES: hypothetical protein [unclassified Brevundimonas]|uniref:hypothetical protein n=1 Tax=unclassified Brevundimonas TaxID=2622653 RepID=UPI0006F29EA5|nr:MULTISPECIES: hypothetical protein [unclassified Brevundimonas]KQY82502.1 hypothetical protein ASD25_25215 [Brevundimonas sp. Root1423]KRA26851.1 hypothetical protein ASD59_05815 [Brevundimonas sp. Root608]
MTLDGHQLAVGASWVATAIGAGLWLWSWLRETDAIRKLRFLDCGVVLLFASVLLRIVAQEKPMSMVDWAMVFVAPLFITAALWRLARTACPPGGR